MKRKILFIVLMTLVFVNVALGDEEDEIFLMKERFLEMVGNKPKVIDEQYCERMADEVIQRFKERNIVGKQYLVFVDRNPKKQLIFVLFFDGQRVIEIGRDRVSTGNPRKGKDYFLTPTGIFENSLENFGYRALGTKNEKGWRGLGKKGARVWDFGWQKTEKFLQGKKQQFVIRLLMHATDPNFGEPRLGNVDSKGCVRISGKLNEFLDRFGILDRDYEENNHKKSTQWLLRKDREPVDYPGKYLIVSDSSQW
jgi:hypothetical protein